MYIDLWTTECTFTKHASLPFLPQTYIASSSWEHGLVGQCLSALALWGHVSVCRLGQLWVSGVWWLKSQGVRRKWSTLCEALGSVPGSWQCQQQLSAIIILLIVAIIPSPGSLGPCRPARRSSVVQTRTDVWQQRAYARSGARGVSNRIRWMGCFLVFWVRVQVSRLPPHCPVAVNHLMFLILLLLLSYSWICRNSPPCSVYEVLGIEARVLYMFGKYSFSQATLPTVAVYLL